jgi:NAD(P)-dependent dehydrogenase (short-subunit alcohol dehydrogenase family)
MSVKDKVIAITGATSGIGEVAAIALAKQGARIVFTARDRERAEATLKKLEQANPAAQHSYHLADLSLLADMQRVGAALAAEPRLDILINNAGALFNTRQLTEDGLEMTFALNHMSYFVITHLLLEKLKATPGARIVSTASGAHRGAKLKFDDLQSQKGYRGFSVYSRSKLCNILFTRELARRLAATDVTANCLHPGFVATRFGDQSGGVVGSVIGVVKNVGAISPDEGAKTLIHLAASPEVDGVSGEYFYKCRIDTPDAPARNDEDARRLWDISEKLAGFSR